MKEKKGYLLPVVICLSTLAHSQELKIGQQMPELVFNNTINYSSNTLKFSDFKGKLIILDFWGPMCYSCLQAFPEIDRLQEMYKDQVQFILVNKGSQQTTEDFFKHRPQLKLPRVPLITSASILFTLFKRSGVPYNVWIDSSGTISNIAENIHLTEKNIEASLGGQVLNIPVSQAYYQRTSLFEQSFEPNLKYYSYLSACIDEGALDLVGPTERENTITTNICLSILELYEAAYGKDMQFMNFNRPGRTVLVAKNPSRYIRPAKPIEKDEMEDWYAHNLYYYHLYLPGSDKDAKFEIMKQDLKRYFGLEARIEKRTINCLTLVSLGSLAKLKTKGGEVRDNFANETIDYEDSVITPVRYYTNKPWAGFSTRLSLLIENILRIPFWNDVTYTGNVDVIMKGETLDNLTVEGVRKELKKYGLGLVEKKKEVEVLVLREKK